MSYGLIYTVPFAALDGTACVVEIEKEGYTGSSAELVAGESPFTVEIEDEEFLYTPTRFSTAKLCVVGGDYLQDLYSINYMQYRVTFLYGNKVTWCGFIKPEVYTQDYTSDVFELELECVSAMSVLEHIDYAQVGATRQFVSLWNLFRRCIAAASARYTTVYFPHVYAADASSYEGSGNAIEGMYISEQNFFDEDDEPMTMLEVLEELCKFFNWTCADWSGALWIVDVDHEWAYRGYNTGLTTYVTYIPSAMSAQSTGFTGSGHSLDILPGYNKVTVKVSNYPVEERSWSLDTEDMEELGATDYLLGNERSRLVYLDSKDDSTSQYELDEDTGEVTPVSLSDYHNNAGGINNLLGAVFVKYCNYEMKEQDGQWKPSITDYDYTDALRIRVSLEYNDESELIPQQTPVFLKTLPPAAYSNGVLCIEGSYSIVGGQQSDFEDMSPLRSPVIGDTGKQLCRERGFILKIGDYGYNGTSWQYGHNGYFTIQADIADDQFDIPNTKLLSDPYDGAKGYIVRIPGILYGELTFGICATKVKKLFISNVEIGSYWTALSVGFVKQNGSDEDDDSDRIYENVINEDFVTELDEIEMKISSYNQDGACYSKVLWDGSLLETMYNIHTESQKRPEELLITRIINHYAHPNVKLTQPLRYFSTLSPATRLTDQFQPGRTFINAGGTIDYRMNRFDCVMIEI